jgi:lipid-A-disaccharide synthase
MARRVFITVAETSGDKHAAQLVRSLRQLDSTITVEGFGGPDMAAAGTRLLRETVADAAMLHHGGKRALEVSRLLKEASQHYLQTRPDLHVCVDSSAMNLHFARRAKQAGIPVLYYVAPQLWASREGRMKKLRAYVDRLACILPFEEEYFRSHGVNATFVGHPLFDELPRDRSMSNGLRFPDAPPVIGIVPGSRKTEVAANLTHLLDVAGSIECAFPGTRFLVPTTPATHAQVVEHAANDRTVVKENAFDELLPQCDLCLCKSGTSTLHVAAYGVPMIVVYRVSRFLWNVLGRWLIRTRKIALVNILAGQTDLVPEFIPWYGSNQPVVDCALDMLKNPEKLNAQRARLNELIKTLDKRGASMNVARMAMEMMGGVRGDA